MTTSNWRNGVCAQHYHVNRIKLKNGHWLDLRKLDAQLFPVGFESSIIVATRPEQIMSGPVSLPNAAGLTGFTGKDQWLVAGIEYCVSACTGKQVVTEDFYHPFKNAPALEQDRPGESAPVWWLYAKSGKLFTTRPLRDMLKVDGFGKMVGAQFCC